MKYDFTSVIDRHGMDAIAVDGLGQMPGFSPAAPKAGFDAIPMWVADMNFPTAPSIQRTITERVQHPAFGYFDARDEYYDAIIRWQWEHHGAEVSRESIGYENGVLGGVISAMNVLCSRGGEVLVHSPTYVGFTHSLEDNGYKIVHSPLRQDEAGVWRMDFADMEEKIVSRNIHAAVFCSPHNPCGRVWERWELEQAMALFEKHDVYVISDEIWSDLVLRGKHIPTQTVSPWAREHTVALYAPSKTFNLAGLVGSYHIIRNKTLRDRVLAESALSRYNSMNLLSMYALIGAYSPEGEGWLAQLLEVLRGNMDFACAFIAEHFPGVSCVKPEGTYMLFVDCSDWCAAHGVSIDEVEQRAWNVGAAVQDGRAFHGKCHLRMNLALPLSRVQEALGRMKTYVFVD